MIVYFEYWSEMQLGALLEFFAVVFGPPVAQVALGVELAAFVVEAVRQFVADGAAGVAIVRRGVGASDRTAAAAARPPGKLMSFICGL